MNLKPDVVKIKHHLEGLISEMNKLGGGRREMIAGLIGFLCQNYDVQEVHDVLRLISNEPKFWEQQRAQKAGRIILA